MNETTQNSEPKPKTWTDTTYSLSADSLLYVANGTHGEAIALKCPGDSRDGHGFAIEFQVEHLEVLQSLVAELEVLKQKNDS